VQWQREKRDPLAGIYTSIIQRVKLNLSLCIYFNGRERDFDHKHTIKQLPETFISDRYLTEVNIQGK
jgi:hypothetical protein